MKIRTLVSLGVAVGMLGLLIWRAGLRSERSVLTAASDDKVASGASVSGTGTSIVEVSSGRGTGLVQQVVSGLTGGVQQADAVSPLISAYAALIGDQIGGIQWLFKAAGLPRMDLQTQQWLMAQINPREGITGKGAQLVLLASKGDLDAARFIWQLLTEGLAGQEISPEDERLLLFLPMHLGQSARFHPEIIAWLEDGAGRGYWEKARSWVSKDAAGANRALQVMCIKGLGNSGAEGLEVLRRLRAVFEAAKDADTLAEIADAAAVNAMVRRYGDARFTGEASAGSARGLVELSLRWLGTAEAQEWKAPYRRALGITR